MRKIPVVAPEQLAEHWKKFGSLLTQEEHEALDGLLDRGYKTYSPDDIRGAIEKAME